jgi:hypothetical protein
MTQETFERIESLIGYMDYHAFRSGINRIANSLLEDGFEYADIKQYLQGQLDEILGTSCSHSEQKTIRTATRREFQVCTSCNKVM